MKALKTILFAIIILNTLNTNAQEAKVKKMTFGIKAGLNIANIDATDDKEFDNTKSRTDFHAGFTLDYTFTDQWYLLTGLEYTGKGTKIDVGGGNELKVAGKYIQLPVCAAYKFRATETIAILVDLGPYFAYGLHGKSKMGSREWDTFSKDIAKKFDCGITFGAGMELNKLYLGLAGETGMINIMEEGNSKAKNRNFKLSVGYKF